MTSQSFTNQLIESDKPSYQRATQSPFLAAAAKGEVPRDVLGQWLANDRMYIHNYISGTGRVLAAHEMPVSAARSSKSGLVGLVDWLIEALANVRREERFFIDTAARYGINIDLPTGSDGRVAESAKLEGLRCFEKLFSSCAPHKRELLPWLEDAVVFWGTEKCYLDAWSWASSQIPDNIKDVSSDADGGALRREFIPNWSSSEFADMVNRLGAIIDQAVDEMAQAGGDTIRESFFHRAQVKWSELLEAERAFWPSM